MHSRITRLLRKPLFQPPFRRQKSLHTIPSHFDRLFTHTFKNNGAHLQLDFSHATPAILALQTAIRQGTPKAAIFSDAQCYRYLLYLLKHERIDFWQGMTAYAYLMALMQFTSQQPLHPADARLKIRETTHAGVEINPLVQNNSVTPFGHYFFEKISANLARLGVELNADHFFQFVSQLAPIDSWVMKTHFHNQLMHYDTKYDEVTSILVDNSPIIFAEQTRHVSHCYTPSFRIIQYLLKQISPRPLALQPILGKIGAEDFQLLHQENFHPVALYDPSSENNLVDPHNLPCGPFSVMSHDLVGHAVWGSLLQPADRERIFSSFIPACETLAALALTYDLDHYDLQVPPRHSLSVRFEIATYRATDFDLVKIKHFVDPQARFWMYLARAFGAEQQELLYPQPPRDYWGNPMLALGARQEDHVFFLLKKYVYQHALTDPWWETLLKFMQMHTSDKVQAPANFAALDCLARMASGQPLPTPVPVTPIDWQGFNMLLDKFSHGRQLWRAMQRQKPQELLALVNEYHCDFFPPLLPLSPDKIDTFKLFVAAKIAAPDTQSWTAFQLLSRRPSLTPR